MPLVFYLLVLFVPAQHAAVPRPYNLEFFEYDTLEDACNNPFRNTSEYLGETKFKIVLAHEADDGALVTSSPLACPAGTAMGPRAPGKP